MLRTEDIDSAAFIVRFLELDDGGRLWKDVVYRQLIEEFAIVLNWLGRRILIRPVVSSTVVTY